MIVWRSDVPARLAAGEVLRVQPLEADIATYRRKWIQLVEGQQ